MSIAQGRGHSFDDEQRRYWEKDSSYQAPSDPTPVAFARPKLEFVQGMLQLARPARVLEVGAGSGVFTHQLRGLFDRVVATDVSHNMLLQNPVRADRALASAYQLPFSDSSFDLVFCGNLLHHVDDPFAVFGEMSRVASSYVVTCEPNRWNVPQLIYSALVPEERRGLRFCSGFLQRLASSSGLTILACSAMGLIYERKTPRFALQALKVFDRPFMFGAYSVLIAKVN